MRKRGLTIVKQKEDKPSVREIVRAFLLRMPLGERGEPVFKESFGHFPSKQSRANTARYFLNIVTTFLEGFGKLCLETSRRLTLR